MERTIYLGEHPHYHGENCVFEEDKVTDWTRLRQPSICCVGPRPSAEELFPTCLRASLSSAAEQRRQPGKTSIWSSVRAKPNLFICWNKDGLPYFEWRQFLTVELPDGAIEMVHCHRTHCCSQACFSFAHSSSPEGQLEGLMHAVAQGIYDFCRALGALASLSPCARWSLELSSESKSGPIHSQGV